MWEIYSLYVHNMPRHTQRNLRSHHRAQINRFFPTPKEQARRRKPKAHAAPAQIAFIQQDGNNLLLLQALIKQAKKHPFLSLLILLMLSSTLIALLRNRDQATAAAPCLGNVTDPHATFRNILLQQQSRLHPLTSHSSPVSESPIFYKSLPVFNVSSIIRDCSDKKIGVSGGKICHIGPTRYYLKALEVDKEQRDVFLLSMYNTALLKHNMGITAPKISLVYEKDGVYKTVRYCETPDCDNAKASFYLASEEVEHFTAVSSLQKAVGEKLLLQHNSSSSYIPAYQTMLRQELVKHIGERGIAQLVVAGSFFGDVVGNSGNWGYNDKGLVVIDVDHSPTNLMGYFVEVTCSLNYIGFDLSLQTVKFMRDSYQKMQGRLVPTLHKEVDMSPSFYDLLLKLYIRACDTAIQKIESNHPDLNEQQPQNVVNKILKDSFTNVMIDAHLHDDFLLPERYTQEGDGDLEAQPRAKMG